MNKWVMEDGNEDLHTCNGPQLRFFITILSSKVGVHFTQSTGMGTSTLSDPHLLQEEWGGESSQDWITKEFSSTLCRNSVFSLKLTPVFKGKKEKKWLVGPLLERFSKRFLITVTTLVLHIFTW